MNRPNIIQVAAGFRSAFYLTDSRTILVSGTINAIKKALLPIRYDLKTQVPEISDDNDFNVVRILATWNNSFTIFYASIADTRNLSRKLKNKQKLNSILNNLSSKWTNESGELNIKIILIIFLIFLKIS